MKRCTSCGCEKPLSEFYKASANKDGLTGQCKSCKDEVKRAWAEANRDKMLAYRKKWDDANRDKVAEKTRRWYEANRERKLAIELARNRANPEKHAASKRKWRSANPEKARQAHKDWCAKNPTKLRELWAKRRAAEAKATPAWANEFFIEEAYELAALRTKMFGFDWHVDHIVPLRSKKVCGLHVEQNLQVIPAKENLSKGNRYWPNMP